MPPIPVRVGEEDVNEDRFSRFRLIPWWDQTKLQSARVLVIGAGALGNEILKNLALLGFQRIVIVDLDKIEESNLSRTILFRSGDVGSYKADVAARSVKSLAPSAKVKPIVANVVQDCGLGIFAWGDVIIAGLDNREARLWINRCAWKMNRAWIDGAIEGINGVARVFVAGTAPCYECTLGETDWKLLEQRMSCNLLLREANTEGKIATTPTISSIIAGIEVQEAVKLLHGMPTLASSGFVFEGLNHTSYKVEYTANPDCMSHFTYESVTELPQKSTDWTLEDLLRHGAEELGARHLAGRDVVVVEFSRDIVHELECPECGTKEEVFAPVGSIRYEQGRCPRDGQMRVVKTIHSYSGTEGFGQRTLDKLGLPLFDVFTVRTADKQKAYLMTGDKIAILGDEL
ncbi:MAG TPA: ThiF family adenylyltransferase [Candidatus Acidoferrum sp.]|jgi:adenylyltransferase/sulfurtransferase